MVKSMERFNTWKKDPKCIQSIHSFLDVVSGKRQKLQVVALICDGGCVGGGGSGGDGDSGGSCDGE